MTSETAGPSPGPAPISATEAAALRPVRKTVRLSGIRTIVALILREMTSSYGRSPGGYAWMILEPLLGILFLTVLFVMIGLRSPQLGTNFAIFFATGILPFNMYMEVSNKTAQSINFSKALLSYPRVTYVDAILARITLTVLTQLLVAVLLISAIRGLFETRTVVQMEPILLSYAMAIVLGAGVGMLNCFLITQFPIWQQVWGIANRPLFFLSGIILILEGLPEQYKEYFLWNPLIHVTAQMRSGFYVGYDVVYVNPAYVFGVGLVLGLVGMVFLHRYHRDMLEL
ncbi:MULTISPECIES: ABC transporter permease [Jannaschia]|nr:MULTISPECIES: ABC transporter permease [unclassified Jannaschia]